MVDLVIHRHGLTAIVPHLIAHLEHVVLQTASGGATPQEATALLFFAGFARYLKVCFMVYHTSHL